MTRKTDEAARENPWQVVAHVCSANSHRGGLCSDEDGYTVRNVTRARNNEFEQEKPVSEVQNQQQGGQQQTQDAAGQATDQAGQAVEGVQDAVGGLIGDQEQGGEGALGGVIDQTQGAAGQVTGQAQDVVGQAPDAVGGLTGGLLGGQQGAGQSGEQEMDDYSYSDSDAETVVNDKTPKGILGQLLNLDILPPPQSDTTTLESGDSGEYYGPE
jgi:uncharacterized protein YjbJ (UPF0337 family)